MAFRSNPQPDGSRERDAEQRDGDSTSPTTDAAFAEVGQQRADEGDAQHGEEEGATSELSSDQDRVLRLRAEMENLRGRTAREISEVRRYAALPLARDLLPVLDNIDRAIEAAEKAGDAGNLLEGFRMVRQQLLGVLQQHDCTPIEAEAAPFDPQFHEAIQQFASDDVPAGNVMTVTQAGYRMHDRIVRPAQVIVSSGAPAGDEAGEPGASVQQ
ncbi:MAG: nucleotide exchange factor GrpE [Planctomycetota bacterium]